MNYKLLINFFSLAFIVEYYFYSYCKLLKKLNLRISDSTYRFIDKLSFFTLIAHIIILHLILIKFLSVKSHIILFIIYGFIVIYNIINEKNYYYEGKRDTFFAKYDLLAKNNKINFWLVYSIIPTLIFLKILL